MTQIKQNSKKIFSEKDLKWQKVKIPKQEYLSNNHSDLFFSIKEFLLKHNPSIFHPDEFKKLKLKFLIYGMHTKRLNLIFNDDKSPTLYEFLVICKVCNLKPTITADHINN